nr:MAG TPA: hypothetical protein [Caudoviricetes sp.]
MIADRIFLPEPNKSIPAEILPQNGNIQLNEIYLS